MHIHAYLKSPIETVTYQAMAVRIHWLTQVGIVVVVVRECDSASPVHTNGPVTTEDAGRLDRQTQIMPLGLQQHEIPSPDQLASSIKARALAPTQWDSEMARKQLV